MRGLRSVFVGLALMLAGAAYVHAQETTDGDTAGENAELKAFVDKLHFKNGTVTVPAANATLKLAPGYLYLDADEAQQVLTMWGNPPDSDVLGMILPQGKKSVMEDNTWAVVVTFSSDGYVSDEDAAKIDYDKMLKEMQEGTRDENASRKKAGYPTVDLVGWAAKPYYDKAANKLYWAKELKFEGNTENTLNYDIRVLGRKGYLSLNALATMHQLPTVEEGMKRVLTMTEFDQGARYADFNSSTDKVAKYGLAALVAGVVASKVGLFGKLIALLLAAKKLVVVGLAAIGGLIAKIFKGKKEA